MSASILATAVPLGFLIGLSLGALGGGGSMLAVPALVAGRVSAARLNRWFVWLLVAVACYTAARSVLAM